MKARKPVRVDEKLAEMVVMRIRQLRHDRGFTQEYVIDHTNLDIGRFETGASVPTLMSLSVLCKFFDITLDEFFAPMNYPSKEQID